MRFGDARLSAEWQAPHPAALSRFDSSGGVLFVLGTQFVMLKWRDAASVRSLNVTLNWLAELQRLVPPTPWSPKPKAQSPKA